MNNNEFMNWEPDILALKRMASDKYRDYHGKTPKSQEYLRRQCIEWLDIMKKELKREQGSIISEKPNNNNMKLLSEYSEIHPFHTRKFIRDFD